MDAPWLAAWQSLYASGPAAAGADTQAFVARLCEQYRQVFVPPAPPAGGAQAGAAALRFQRAFEAMAAILAGVAADAARRFTEEIGRDGPPITTLRALQDLWIDCGERAWAAAAHRDDFAGTQAELLVALAGLPPRGPAS